MGRRRQLEREVEAFATELDPLNEPTQRLHGFVLRGQPFSPGMRRLQHRRQPMRLKPGLFQRERESRAVAEHTARCGHDSLLELGRGDAPPLFGVLRSAPDQCLGNVIAVTALTLGCPLHIQRLAAFIEQLAGERTPWRRGLPALAPAHPSFAQPLLDLLPQLTADNRRVLSGMAFALVPDFAQIDGIRE